MNICYNQIGNEEVQLNFEIDSQDCCFVIVFFDSFFIHSLSLSFPFLLTVDLNP